MENESQSAYAERRAGLLLGLFIGDALAMPVHWYYDRRALHRDYGWVSDYLAPREWHPDSILHRSHFKPVNDRAEILHAEAKRHWGKRGAHYHSGLTAGENTLNLILGFELLQEVVSSGDYDADRFLKLYLDFMRTPGKHRDVYVEECHREFFQNHARGKRLRKCGVDDNHIGGLASVGILVAGLDSDLATTRSKVQEHVGLTHQNQRVLRAADCLTVMLWRVLRGATLEKVLGEEATDYFSARKSARRASRSDAEVVEQDFSPACYIEKAFPASLYLAWKYAEDLAPGLVSNTNLGGDNCHRGAVVGALLGAANGIRSIPSGWIDGLILGPALKRVIAMLPEREIQELATC